MTKTAVEIIIQALNAAKVKYLIVGGVAAAVHGVLRFTADIDIVLEMTPDNIERAVKALSDLGYRARAPVPFSQFQQEAQRNLWIREKGLTVFSLWSDQFAMTEIDLFIECPFDSFDAAWQNAVQVEITSDISAVVVGIHDLIQLKQKAGRPQDLADIEKLKKLLETK